MVLLDDARPGLALVELLLARGIDAIAVDGTGGLHRALKQRNADILVIQHRPLALLLQKYEPSRAHDCTAPIELGVVRAAEQSMLYSLPQPDEAAMQAMLKQINLTLPNESEEPGAVEPTQCAAPPVGSDHEGGTRNQSGRVVNASWWSMMKSPCEPWSGDFLKPGTTSRPAMALIPCPQRMSI